MFPEIQTVTALPCVLNLHGLLHTCTHKVHGDIKGPNVLISDAGTVQVTEFGVSIVDHREIEFSVTSGGRGTHRWQASINHAVLSLIDFVLILW
ncbi:hypothetical protein OPQ81_008439 [Rhizoctonia solani]|nr:hypothetical protein OPQ81_008439 [Rhizoctonia solani]